MSGEQMTIATPRTPSKKMTVTEVIEHPELVEEVLLEQEEASRRIKKLGLRPLGKGLKSLIWGLRVYVFFMVVVVVINLVHTFH